VNEKRDDRLGEKRDNSPLGYGDPRYSGVGKGFLRGGFFKLMRERGS